MFDTPLPQPRDFAYWSDRFIDRQTQYQATAEVQHDKIEVTLPEPVVVNFIGDVHIGSPNTDYRRVAQEIEAIINTPNSYVMLLGDLVDGFFWNPAQMNQIEQTPEQFQYAQSLIAHLAEKEKILVGWGGDHDNWAKQMGISAYIHFAQEARAHYLNGVGYITMNVGAQQYFLTGAHRLPGSSTMNHVNPGMRAGIIGSGRGSDIVVHAHTHKKGYSLQPIQDFGGVGRNVHYISVGPYKSTDDYAQKHGFNKQCAFEMYGSAVILRGDSKRIEYYPDILVANEEIKKLI